MGTGFFPSGGFSVVRGQGPYVTTERGFQFANPFATNTWFVDGTNGSDEHGGNAPGNAFATIAEAISSGAAGDTIIIAPGTYTITAALVPKANQTFLAGKVFPRKPSVIITGNIADLIQVDVAGVAFFGIEFKASGATADNLVDVADAAAVDGLYFNSCVFNGADQTSVVGIKAADATFAVTNMVVENCLFRDLTGTMIQIGVLGMAYSLIRNNHFALDVNSGVCISLADTTTFAIGKAYAIVDNIVTGFDATADEVFISIAGTEDTTGAGIIAGNKLAFVAAVAITQDKLEKALVENYVGSANGGALVDPSA